MRIRDSCASVIHVVVILTTPHANKPTSSSIVVGGPKTNKTITRSGVAGARVRLKSGRTQFNSEERDMKCNYCKNETKGNRTRCPSCNTKIRRLRGKLTAVKYLGGKCNRCGYDKHTAAMEFHHKNPAEKEFNIGCIANKKWATIIKELDKCELLCSNCHRIHHSNRTDEIFMQEALNEYRGNLYLD